MNDDENGATDPGISDSTSLGAAQPDTPDLDDGSEQPVIDPAEGWQIWEQWEGEPDVWYRRFLIYMLQPRGTRSIAETVRQSYLDRNPDVTEAEVDAWTPEQARTQGRRDHFYTFRVKYRWDDRVEAYDRYQDRLETEADVKERLRARARRRSVIAKLGDALLQGLPVLDPEKMSWTAAVLGTKAFTEASRVEYDDVPASRSEMAITIAEVQQFVVTIVEAFNEVNRLDDPNERQEQFEKKLATLYSGESESVT